MRIFLSIIFVMTVLFLECGSSTDENIKISFVGDIIMHGPVRSCAYRNNKKSNKTGKSVNNRGFDFLFKKIRNRLHQADFVVGNMEFPVTPPFVSKGMVFNSHPEVIASLQSANFSLLSIANNHMLDQGLAGLEKTIRYLESYKMRFVGAHRNSNESRKGVIVPIKGIRIGYIAYTGVINKPYSQNKNEVWINRFYDTNSVVQDIKNIKKKCDFLVMVAHYGTEYILRPHKWDISRINQYCDAGVDLFIGHHPHMLQPYSKYLSADGRECNIFYSLGNFISNQSWKNLPHIKKRDDITPQDSIIVESYIRKEGNGYKTKFVLVPIVTLNEHDKRFKQDYYRSIQTVSAHELLKLLGKKENKKNRKIIEVITRRVQGIKKTILNGKKYKHISFAE